MFRGWQGRPPRKRQCAVKSTSNWPMAAQFLQPAAAVPPVPIEELSSDSSAEENDQPDVPVDDVSSLNYQPATVNPEPSLRRSSGSVRSDTASPEPQSSPTRDRPVPLSASASDQQTSQAPQPHPQSSFSLPAAVSDLVVLPSDGTKAALRKPKVRPVARVKSRFPQCRHCDGVFLSPVLLALHVQEHEDSLLSKTCPDSLNRCTSCPRRFLGYDVLTEHMMLRHPGSPIPPDVRISLMRMQHAVKTEIGTEDERTEPTAGSSSTGRQPAKKRLRNPEIRIDFARSPLKAGSSSSKTLPPLVCNYCKTEHATLTDMEHHIVTKHEDKLCVAP